MSKRKRQRDAAKTRSEEHLEGLLFGSGGASSRAGQRESRAEEVKASEEDAEGLGLAPAWVDEDDDNLEVDLDAVNRLRKLKKDSHSRDAVVTGREYSALLAERFATRPCAWATLPAEGPSAHAEDPEADASSFLAAGDFLPKNKIHLIRQRDANAAEPATKAITALSFHMDGGILMAGSADKTLKVFRVDGDENPKIHSVTFNDMPILAGQFLGPTSEVIVTGRRPFFYSYDMESGSIHRIAGLIGKTHKSYEGFVSSNDGTRLAFLGAGGFVHIGCGQTKQWIADLKMNVGARACVFGDSSNVLYTSGIDADIYVWDIRQTSRCVQRFAHDDGTGTQALAVNPHLGGLLAVGSESGVVSIYQSGARESRLATTHQKLKSILNLTTVIDSLTFAPDGQMLAMGSSQKKDALKLVHLPSCTVFQNWPTDKTPLKRPTSLMFSPGGGYFAVGNNRGRVVLYRVPYYSNA